MTGEGNHFHPHQDVEAGPVVNREEVMVADVRAGLTPAQMVERRLVSLLKATPLPLSQLQATGARRPL